jgi:hypothetical protein
LTRSQNGESFPGLSFLPAISLPNNVPLQLGDVWLLRSIFLHPHNNRYKARARHVVATGSCHFKVNDSNIWSSYPRWHLAPGRHPAKLVAAQPLQYIRPVHQTRLHSWAEQAQLSSIRNDTCRQLSNVGPQLQDAPPVSNRQRPSWSTRMHQGGLGSNMVHWSRAAWGRIEHEICGLRWQAFHYLSQISGRGSPVWIDRIRAEYCWVGS